MPDLVSETDRRVVHHARAERASSTVPGNVRCAGRRAAPQALLEPWAGATVNSLETMTAFRAEVGEVRFLIDTGHVADWGGDPCELLGWADHIQLRQGKPGHTQLHVDDPTGVVDFAALFRELDRIDYRGKVSVEHFDLPQNGWALADPEQWARDLAARLRAL